MQHPSKILECYNKTAEKYAQKFLRELDSKPLDRILLKAFADQNADRGRLIDLGCGPGQTTRFIYDQGFNNVLGVDIAAEMIRVAKASHHPVSFEQADLLKLMYDDCSFGSALAFYSIVNFDYPEIEIALKEISRILVRDGELLFSFHAGNEIVHLNEFLGEQVDIKFQLFDTDRIKQILKRSGLIIIDLIKRAPYPTEHPTERAYIWVKKG